MMRNKAFVSLAALCLLVVLFILRGWDLTIHIIVESANPKGNLIHIQIDEETVFQSEIKSGVYSSEMIVVENVDIGFHILRVEAAYDGIVYEGGVFTLFNQSLIVNYFGKNTSEFDDLLEEKNPRFFIWSKFGKFLMD